MEDLKNKQRSVCFSKSGGIGRFNEQSEFGATDCRTRMSQVKLEAPFDEVRGKICKHTKIIYKKINGKTFTSQICNPRTKAYTAAELARQTKFTQAANATKQAMSDPDQLVAYTAAFVSQKRYKTLHGYIFAQEYAKL